RQVAGKMRCLFFVGSPQAAAPDIFLLLLQNRCPQAIGSRGFPQILAAESVACFLERPCLPSDISADLRIGVHLDKFFFILAWCERNSNRVVSKKITAATNKNCI